MLKLRGNQDRTPPPSRQRREVGPPSRRAIQGLRVKVQGVGCRMKGVECRVVGVGCKIQGRGVGCRVKGVGCRVQGVGVRGAGFFRIGQDSGRQQTDDVAGKHASEQEG